MKLYLVDDYGVGKFVESDAVPRVGDRVEWSFVPAPYVHDVVWFVKIGEVEVTAVIKIGGKR